MRILITIPHFFGQAGPSKGGPRRHNRGATSLHRRAAATSAALASLHQLFCGAQARMSMNLTLAGPANLATAGRIDVIVCTSRDHHLLDYLSVPAECYLHHDTICDPRHLGFECHAVLRNELGRYDYYCYLEDDLVLHDPWFFCKLRWFTGLAGDEALLQPNRYEVGFHPSVHKLYVDGDLKPEDTARFQNPADSPPIVETAFGVPVAFCRTLNPHSGCFFLTAAQMERWSRQPYFLDRDASFYSSLESAATIGIMRTFKVYKPAPENAGFLEVEHADPRFLPMIRPVKHAHRHAT